jgi:RimJ/RimL family protein N-acetyltransferase
MGGILIGKHNHHRNYEERLLSSNFIMAKNAIMEVNMNIETDNLIIRNFELKDEEDLCEYMLQRVHAEFEAYSDFTREKGKQVIEFRANSDEFYAIELKKEHKVIGNVYLGNREFNTRELGYVLNVNYQKQGYGWEACKAAIDFMFHQGVHRIYAETAPQNISSWKLMEKLSMNREAHFRKNVSFHQDADGNPIYWDTYVYALLNPQENL